MANINTNIRFYQPNDPYYFEVDNLPLTDLLNNDITLENRISDVENLIDNLGGSQASGVISFEALKDLKAYVSQDIQEYGKVFVNPGKFTARMSLPATRESGWRMMGDASDDFNNQKRKTTTELSTEASQSKMVARTAVVDFSVADSGKPQSISIPTFDSEDFTNASNPSERIDVVFVRAAVSMDRDGNPTTKTDLGLLKGAFFRLDGTGEHLDGKRFTDYPLTNLGRMTGQSAGDIEEGTTLWGSVPLPEDLINYEWKNNQASAGVMLNGEDFSQKQVAQSASFCLPVAYVRVESTFRTGGIIDQDKLIDIRPFLRSAELTYGERAAISRSDNPNGANPFMTKSGTLYHITKTNGNLSELDGRVTIVEGQVASLSTVQGDLVRDVYGPSGLDHEGRINALEGAPSGISGPFSYTDMKTTGIDQVLRSSNLAGSTTYTWNFNNIPTNDRAKTVFVQLRFLNWRAAGDDTTTVLTQEAIINQSFPQVNTASQTVLRAWKQSEMTGMTTEVLVPVSYDAFTDTVSASFRTGSNILVLDSNRGGAVNHSGVYVVKEMVT